MGPRVVLVLSTITLALCLAFAPRTTHRVASAARLAVEPQAAAEFVTAFGLGDEAAADRVASPLYHFEWDRRAVTVEQRAALVPRHDDAAPWLHFRFLEGVVDASGFGHLLYTAMPPATTKDGVPSVWRVDLDPSGRVIWCELVWLFSEGTYALVPVSGGDPAREIPHGIAGDKLLMGVRAQSSQEGYYAVGGTMEGDGRPTGVLFFAVGPDGGKRMGAWSYGDSSAAPRNRLMRLVATPDVVQLRKSYVLTL